MPVLRTSPPSRPSRDKKFKRQLLSWRRFATGSATVPVAVFGVAPKTRQTDLSNDGLGATPKPTGETPALPPNVQRKMNLARRSSPAPSARHIGRTQTKKTKSLTCLRHPLPSDSPRCRAVAAGGRGTKPRRGGIFFDNSPAFQGWDSSRTNIQSPVRDGRRWWPCASTFRP